MWQMADPPVVQEVQPRPLTQTREAWAHCPAGLQWTPRPVCLWGDCGICGTQQVCPGEGPAGDRVPTVSGIVWVWGVGNVCLGTVTGEQGDTQSALSWRNRQGPGTRGWAGLSGTAWSGEAVLGVVSGT